MGELFARYLEAGIFGSVIILVILLLRLFLRKAPRRILCLLWLLAAIRLILPFQLESKLSLQPDLENAAGAVQQLQFEQTDLPVADVEPVVPTVSTDIPQTAPVTIPQNAVKTPVDPMLIVTIVWLSVACAAVGYLIVSYGLLKFRVREAVKREEGIMECDRIRGAFLLGYFRPKIYLPFNVSNRDRGFIIAHERAHIARGDNWWKLLGFLCAGIHWYNPLVWFAYVLLCRDIELACDEKVIRELNLDERKAYSMALLNCGKSLAGVSVCPVAFGEVSLKTRIKNVLRYRKPGVWITVISLVLVTAVAVCFLTSPMAEALPQKETPEETQEQTEPSAETSTVPAEMDPIPETTEHVHTYTVQRIESTCLEGGCDIYTCSCGDTFLDNPTEPRGHNWVHNPKYYNHKYSISHPLVCTFCNEETWFVENVNRYPDLNYNGVRDAVLAYARSLGFQTIESGHLENSLSYSTYYVTHQMRNSTSIDWEEYLTDIGCEFVDRAYAYCLDNNLPVSEQTILFENDHRSVDINSHWKGTHYESRLYSTLYFTQNRSV